MLNSRTALAVWTVAVLALPTGTTAQQASATSERFSFTSPELKAAPGGSDASRLTIVVRRWSADEERDRVVAAAAETPARAQLELRQMNEAGHIEWPGALRYTLRYAHRVARPDGGFDVILATDTPVWMWWDSAQAAQSVKHPYTVIQLRLNKEGHGEGRLSLSGRITGDKQARTIAVEDFATTAPVLQDVRREKSVDSD
jgi:hypothetical protein